MSRFKLKLISLQKLLRSNENRWDFENPNIGEIGGEIVYSKKLFLSYLEFKLLFPFDTGGILVKKYLLKVKVKTSVQLIIFFK